MWVPSDDFGYLERSSKSRQYLVANSCVLLSVIIQLDTSALRILSLKRQRRPRRFGFLTPGTLNDISRLLLYFMVGVYRFRRIVLFLTGMTFITGRMTF